MTVKDKIRAGFGFPKTPDFGEIQRLMDHRFGQLLAKLDEILVELKKQTPKA